MRRFVPAVLAGQLALVSVWPPARALAQESGRTAMERARASRAGRSGGTREPPGAESEARRYARAGDEAFRLGHYLVAATAYEEAYRRAPLPALVFSAAQAHRRQYFVDLDRRRLERARELYRQYLDTIPAGGRRDHAVTHLQTIDLLLARPPDDPSAPLGTGPSAAPGAGSGPSTAPPERPRLPETQIMVVSQTPGARASIDGGARAPVPIIRTVAAGQHRVQVEATGYVAAARTWPAVEGRLVVAELDLRERPARLRVRAPEGATVFVDGRRAGVAPLAGPLVLRAGRHHVVATARGRAAFEHTLVLRRDADERVVASMPTTARRYVAWCLLAGGASSLLAAGATTLLAYAAESRASSSWDRVVARRTNLTEPELARYRDDLALRDDLRIASVVLAASALALGVSWALAFWLDLPAPGRDQSVAGTR